MITFDKLKIYEAFRGDPDMWGRARRRRDREILSDEDWKLIDELIQELTLVNRNLASETNAAQIEKKVQVNTTDSKVADRLKALARRSQS